MSADVIYGIDFRNKCRQTGKVDRPETMEEWATRILTEAGAIAIADTAPSEMIPYHGAGIDGMYPPDAS